MSKVLRCRYCLDLLIASKLGGASHDYATARETMMVPTLTKGKTMPFSYTGRSSLRRDEPYCDDFLPNYTVWGLSGTSYEVEE